MSASDSTKPAFSVRLNRSEAELVLSALDHAVSYVLEERSPEDRSASEETARQFGALRARLLRLVAARTISAPDAEEEQLQHA